MSWFGRLALPVLALLAASCTAFPEIPSGECGNGVVEAGEDCDRFAHGDGLVCRAKEASDACHFDCAPRAGLPGVCPEGWGCDAGFVCRKPSGNFAGASLALDVGAWSLAAGDFDGDGRGDVMSLEPLDSIGATRLRFFYFDAQGGLAETRDFPKSVISPVVHDLSGEGRSDVAFAGGPIGLMLGRADRTWLPETFSSYRISGAVVRTVTVLNRRIERGVPMEAVITYPAGGDMPSGLAFMVLDAATNLLRSGATLAGTIADLAGDPVSGNLFEDAAESPCFESVLALRGTTHFTVIDSCTRNAQGEPIWRQNFQLGSVALEPPAAIDAAPQIFDLNSDGHLDVLLGAGGRAYAAYGDGTRLAPAIPYRVPLSNDNTVDPEIPMPLVVGDLTGDGAPDFVFPDHLLLSVPVPGSPLPMYSPGVRNHLGSAWTAAVIADLNGNGKADLVTASDHALNLQFFNGTGSASLTSTSIATSAPVQFLETGDFDGDQLTDLAFFEQPSNAHPKATLKVAFGVPFAVPAAPLLVAEVDHPEGMRSYADQGVSNLIVASQEIVLGESSGALTFLNGGPDRVPFAPYALTDFELTGNVEDSPAVAIAAGSFSQNRGSGDLLALAFHPSDDAQSRLLPMEPWLLRSVNTLGTYPVRLAASIDPVLSPLRYYEQNLDFTADVVSASADFDNDGRDEAVFAMPAGPTEAQCGVLSFALSGWERSQPAARGRTLQETVLLDEPCPDPQLAPVDADGDGFLDLALLTGRSRGNDRKLYLLWNDGTGHFSSDRTQLVSGTDSPEAFTVLPASKLLRLGIAYVTADALRIARPLGSSRDFSETETLQSVNAGTGLVASDVNGDRVPDLVLAEAGQLRVLKAELVAP